MMTKVQADGLLSVNVSELMAEFQRFYQNT